VVFVGFFLCIEGGALLIDLSLCEDAWFDFYLIVGVEVVFLRDFKLIIFIIFI
jgi:hypothetical protein